MRAPSATPCRCAEARDLCGRHAKFRQRPVGRLGPALRQRQHGAAIDHARQRALAEPHVVDEAVAPLSEPAGALRNASEERRQRGLPGARHDQYAAIALAPQPGRQGALLGKREASAREVHHNGLAQPRHVVGQRRAQGGRQHVNRPRRETRLQEFHDRVAAHEVADPHVRHDQNRASVRRAAAGISQWLMK